MLLLLHLKYYLTAYCANNSVNLTTNNDDEMLMIHFSNNNTLYISKNVLYDEYYLSVDAANETGREFDCPEFTLEYFQSFKSLQTFVYSDERNLADMENFVRDFLSDLSYNIKKAAKLIYLLGKNEFSKNITIFNICLEDLFKELDIDILVKIISDSIVGKSYKELIEFIYELSTIYPIFVEFGDITCFIDSYTDIKGFKKCVNHSFKIYKSFSYSFDNNDVEYDSGIECDSISDGSDVESEIGFDEGFSSCGEYEVEYLQFRNFIRSFIESNMVGYGGFSFDLKTKNNDTNSDELEFGKAFIQDIKNIVKRQESSPGFKKRFKWSRWILKNPDYREILWYPKFRFTVYNGDVNKVQISVEKQIDCLL